MRNPAFQLPSTPPDFHPPPCFASRCLEPEFFVGTVPTQLGQLVKLENLCAAAGSRVWSRGGRWGVRGGMRDPKRLVEVRH